MIDYNVLYAESQAPAETFTTGDLILIGLLGLLLLAFFIALWKLEHWGDRLLHWWQHNIMPQNTLAFQGAGVSDSGRVPMPSINELASPAPKPAGSVVIPPAVVPVAVAGAELEELYQRKPELRQLAPYLMGTDDKTLTALAALLAKPGASDAIARLSQLDLGIVAELQALSSSDQALLLALAQKR